MAETTVPQASTPATPSTSTTPATTSSTVPATTGGGADLAPAAERGTLDVRTKALEHLVEAAVLQTPGTVRRSRTGSLGSLVGGGSPRATVSMDGRGARIEVDAAAAWPCAASRIATDVRDRVLAEAGRFSGIPIRTVDVTIHVVDPSDADQPQRRRVR